MNEPLGQMSTASAEGVVRLLREAEEEGGPVVDFPERMLERAAAEAAEPAEETDDRTLVLLAREARSPGAGQA